MIIVDAHQDLAWNMLTFGRDYTRSAAQTRQIEAGTIQIKVKEDTLLGWPDYQRGQVALVFATLFALPQRLRAGEWEILAYPDLSQANRLYWQQIDLYHRLVSEAPDRFRLLETRRDLQALLEMWRHPDPVKDVQGELEAGALGESQDERPVGLVLLMEGAEGVRSSSELEQWYKSGLRLIGPAWAGNRFCGGTREPGRLTDEGIELLERMAELNFGLDISHMDEIAAMQALDRYPGRIIATHSNVKALLKGTDSNRHLSDALIRRLLERDGVIGVVPLNTFLLHGWQQGDRRDLVGLDLVVAQIETICQMAGDANHVGIGSDFDGGFGLQSVPAGIDTIADLQKLTGLLSERGYSTQDVAGILGDNWLRFLQDILG